MDKLQIAIEALETQQRLRNDSRNWGIINSEVDEALKQIKEEPYFDVKSTNESGIGEIAMNNKRLLGL